MNKTKGIREMKVIDAGHKLRGAGWTQGLAVAAAAAAATEE